MTNPDSGQLPIDDNRVASIHYQLTNGFGDVIDSSLGGLPLAYMHNSGAFLPALERELTGAVKGDNLEIVIYPEDGYGYPNEELIQELEKEAFSSIEKLSEGMRVRGRSSTGEEQMFTVVEIRDDAVVVDANHPLAGQVLNFNVAVVAVREPTDEEVAQGFASSSNVPASSPLNQ